MGDIEPVVLTDRERDVVDLLSRDCTYSQVADRLGISCNTVITHIKNAYSKLGVHSAAAAVKRAIELRLLGVSVYITTHFADPVLFEGGSILMFV